MVYDYQIYQMNMSDETAPFMFMNYKWAIEHGWLFDGNYHKAYEGQVFGDKLEPTMDNIFMKFNLERPDDYPGHSLSMSDIIGIKEVNMKDFTYYYIDSFGFKNVTSEVLSAREE